MGKIFYIMGKTASGKDTIFRELKERCPQLGMVVPYTTRPIRAGEKNGVEYFFTDEAALAKMEAEHKIIEIRSYDTVHGIWKYFTAADGQIDLESSDYLMIGTLESYGKLKKYYGAAYLVPVYIEVEDGERLNRALTRERQQEVPRYAEMCRRFLADTEDFSEDHLRAAGIKKRYYNDDQKRCLDEIIEDIRYGKF